MQIQISWLLKKPTDLDLHCLQRQSISGFRRTRDTILKVFSTKKYIDTCFFFFFTSPQKKKKEKKNEGTHYKCLSEALKDAYTVSFLAQIKRKTFICNSLLSSVVPNFVMKRIFLCLLEYPCQGCLYNPFQSGEPQKEFSNRQTVQTQIRCHKMLDLIRVYSVGMNRTGISIKYSNSEKLFTLAMLNKLLPHPLLIFSQSDYMILIVDINSHT